MPRVDLAGVCDLHVHSAPYLFDRIADDEIRAMSVEHPQSLLELKR